MKKLYIRTFLISLPLFLLMLISIYLPAKKGNKAAFFSSGVFKDSLLENVSAPRILFLGGSNLFYGLNCQLIKDSFQLNPINTSVHAGLGLEFILNHHERYVRSGDIVVVAPEYHQFFGTMVKGNVALLDFSFDGKKGTFSELNFMQKLFILQYMPEYALSKWKAFTYNNVLNQKANKNKLFNDYGDITLFWNASKPAPVTPYARLGAYNPAAIKALVKFKEKVKAKGAHLFVTYPCYQDKSYDNAFDEIMLVESKLKENGFEIISSPEEYRVADSLTFDSPYHLSKKGAELRTNLLIKDLRKVVK